MGVFPLFQHPMDLYEKIFLRKFDVLGSFVKLRKATISFVMYICLSVCLSVRLEKLGSHWWTHFHEIWYLIIFSKICRENSSFIKIWREQRALHMKTCAQLWQYLAELFTEWEMFQKIVLEKIKTHILRSKTFFRKSCRLWDNVEKFGRARQATDDNIIRRMRFACWITKATDTHSEYVILIAVPWQQWLRERASILRRTYSAYLVTAFLFCTGECFSKKLSRIQGVLPIICKEKYKCVKLRKCRQYHLLTCNVLFLAMICIGRNKCTDYESVFRTNYVTVFLYMDL
jgi:hypothetical protein